jgi:hypothetical protein
MVWERKSTEALFISPKPACMELNLQEATLGYEKRALTPSSHYSLARNYNMCIAI